MYCLELCDVAWRGVGFYCVVILHCIVIYCFVLALQCKHLIAWDVNCDWFVLSIVYFAILLTTVLGMLCV